MNIYMIRNKKTKEIIKLNSGRYFWDNLTYLELDVENHNYPTWMQQPQPVTREEHEVVEFSLREDRVINFIY